MFLFLQWRDVTNFLQVKSNVGELASEWERFLLAYGDASKSTPHLYISALSWLPRTSKLWLIVHNSFSSEIPMTSNVPEAWSDERWSEDVSSIVRSVAYSHDGRLFAAGCKDGSMRFWEPRSGIRVKEAFITGSGALSIAFSPDNHWLASGHWDGSIQLWHLAQEPSEHLILRV